MERAPGSPSPGAFWSIPSCGSWHWDTGMGRLLFPANVLQPKRRVLKTLERSASPFFSKLAHPPPPKGLGEPWRPATVPLPRQRTGHPAPLGTPPRDPEEGFFFHQVLRGETREPKSFGISFALLPKRNAFPARPCFAAATGKTEVPPPPPNNCPQTPTGAPWEAPPSLESRGAPGGVPPLLPLPLWGWLGWRRGGSVPEAMPTSPARPGGDTHTLGHGTGQPRFSIPSPTVQGCGAPPGSAPALLALPPTTGGCSGAGCIIISY